MWVLLVLGVIAYVLGSVLFSAPAPQPRRLTLDELPSACEEAGLEYMNITWVRLDPEDDPSISDEKKSEEINNLFAPHGDYGYLIVGHPSSISTKDAIRLTAEYWSKISGVKFAGSDGSWSGTADLCSGTGPQFLLRPDGKLYHPQHIQMYGLSTCYAA